jgi:hypothetical protein
MSKRAGDLITLDELLDEVGPDAARYTLLARSSDSAIDFDIEVVTRQTMDNPVYYVQYAHARIASLLRVAEERGVRLPNWRAVDLNVLTQPAELDLIRALSEFPETVAAAASSLTPHRLAHFIEEVGASYHHFYNECRVLGEDEGVTHARLWQSAAAKRRARTRVHGAPRPGRPGVSGWPRTPARNPRSRSGRRRRATPDRSSTSFAWSRPRGALTGRTSRTGTFATTGRGSACPSRPSARDTLRWRGIE